MVRSSLTGLLLTLCVSLSIAACGSEQQAATPAAPAPAAAAPAPAPQEEAPATPEATTGQATEAQESSGDASAAEDKTDASLERLAALPPAQQLPAGRWKAGVNYVPLVPAQPTSVPADKVEVVEVFWYGCPHCYALEPFIESWLANKADYIQFVPVPVMWGPVHRAHARLYYTLQALGRSDLHKAVFDTIQQGGNMLVANNDERTLEMQVDFAKAHGIDPAAFRKAYDSFSVNSNLQRAEELTRRYRVEGVPEIVINGKYTTDVGQAGNHGNLIALINDLAAAEHRR